MRFIEKKRYSNGRRHIYLLGIKIFSYKKKTAKKIGKRSLFYRIVTYPLAVYDEYQRLKFELKK